MAKFVEGTLQLNVPWTTKFKRQMDEYSIKSETWVKSNTKMIPYVDRWSTTSRVILVVTGIIPPVVFIIFWLFLYLSAFVHNR